MKKAVLLFFAILLCLLVLCGCERERGEENPASDFEYVENEDGGITITKYIGESKDVVIPKKIDGKYITEIGEHAFVKITTNESGEIIDVSGSDVVSVDIPDKVNKIEGAAFRLCGQLEKINMPKSLKKIGGLAFYRCEKLTGITFPSSLEEIGDEAFNQCKSLTYVNIPGSITVWGEGTFNESGLEKVTIENGVEFIPSAAFRNTKIKSVIIPPSVKEIEFLAFSMCFELESVVLNEGLVTIGDTVFIYNTKLTEIVLPSTVENVTDNCFLMCENLKKIMFEGNAPEFFDDLEENGPPATIYYHEGAEGFTSPEWNGYPVEIW